VGKRKIDQVMLKTGSAIMCVLACLSSFCIHCTILPWFTDLEHLTNDHIIIIISKGGMGAVFMPPPM